MIAITSRAIGTIRFRSDSIAWSKSYWIAEPPPTRALRPGPRSSRLDRISGTASNASGVKGSPLKTTSTVRMVPSVETFGVGVAEATRSMPVTASAAAWASASVASPSSRITRIVVGASVPAGNASSISSKPSTDSTDFLKKFVVE